MKITCSRCGNVIIDTFIRVESSIIVNRLLPNGMIESCNNLKDTTAELLCPECFNAYCDCLNQLNDKYQAEEKLNTIVEVVDGIQYSEGYIPACPVSTEEIASMVEIIDDGVEYD